MNLCSCRFGQERNQDLSGASSIVRVSRHSIRLCTFAELCLPSRNRKLAKNRQDIYLRSISFDKKTKDPYHYVHSHGICFESELIAMRVYFDHRQTIDLWQNQQGTGGSGYAVHPSEEQIQAGSDDCLW